MNLLLALLIFIGDVTSGMVTLGVTQPTNIHISNGTKAVDIMSDGHVEFASGTTLDDAAKAFWKYVETSNPLWSEVIRLKDENERLKTALRFYVKNCRVNCIKSKP